MDEAHAPEVGEPRIGEDGEVYVFDGRDWQPYRSLPPDDHSTLLRHDPEGHYRIGDAATSGRRSDEQP
jgi:hypothetical protein